MKKNFPLKAPNKADARVVESVKSDVRKYIARERRKTLPAGFDTWTFACRVGAAAETAEPCEVPGLGAAIDAVATAGAPGVYIEVLAVPGHRVSPPPGEPAKA
jgi:hypothetical protein